MTYSLPRTPNQRAMSVADAVRLSMLGGSIMRAMNEADEESPGLSLLRHKAAVPAATTSGNSALVPLHATEVEFIASMLNTLLGRISIEAVKLASEMAPIAATVLGGNGGSHAEGAPKRVTALGFDAITLTRCMGYGLIVLSRDFVKIAPLATPLIARELRNVVGLESDKAAIGVLIAGIVALTASGTTAAAFAADVARMAAQISTGAGSSLVLGINPDLLKRVALLTTTGGELAFPALTVDGGELQGIAVTPTDALAADSSGSSMILVDAAQIGFADGPVEIRNSQQATLQMNNAPDSPPTASTVATSLWQQNLVASLAERHFGIARLRDSAVSIMEACNYGSV